MVLQKLQSVHKHECSKTHITGMDHIARLTLQGMFGVQARRGCQAL